MRIAVTCLLLAATGCQGAGCPGVAPRLAVSKVTRERTTSGVTTTRVHEFTYSDDLTLAGKELERATLTISSSSGNEDREADLTFDYSEGRLRRIEQTSDHDELDANTDYLYYSDRDLFKKLEVDWGDSGILDADIELFYDDGGRLEMITYSMAWWILQENERADVVYDDRGYIQDLDGDDIFVRYSWGDTSLNRVEVQNDNGDDHDYQLFYDGDQLQRIEDDDDDWTLSYDDAGRLTRIEAETAGYQEIVDYEYADGSIQGVRVAPRVPVFVNWVIGLDGRALADIDVLTLPDYFTD